MQHCGLQSKTESDEVLKGLSLWSQFRMNLHGFHSAYYCFLVHLTPHCLPLLSFHTLKTVPKCLQLPLALSSVAAIKDDTNPVDVFQTMPLLISLPTAPGNLSRVSLWLVSLSSPGPAASSWHGWGEVGQLGSLTTRITANPLTVINSPSGWGLFHFKRHGNLSKFPSNTPNCCFILGRRAELFLWLLPALSEWFGSATDLTVKPHTWSLLGAERSVPPWYPPWECLDVQVLALRPCILSGYGSLNVLQDHSVAVDLRVKNRKRAFSRNHHSKSEMHEAWTEKKVIYWHWRLPKARAGT